MGTYLFLKVLAVFYLLCCVACSDGYGSKFFDPGWVSHLWFGFGKLPLKTSNFNFFPFRSKKISPGLVKKYPGQKWAGLLFSAGQN